MRGESVPELLDSIDERQFGRFGFACTPAFGRAEGLFSRSFWHS